VSNSLSENSEDQVRTYLADKIELGTWFLGLECYTNTHNHSFLDGNREKAAARDWSNDIRIIHSTLLTCGSLLSKLNSDKYLAVESRNDFQTLVDSEYSKEELNELSALILNFTILSETILKSKKNEFFEWTAFCNIFSNAIVQSKAFKKVICNLNQPIFLLIYR
jgi:hypothetical protein